MGIDARVMSPSKFGSGVPPLGAVLGVDSTLTRNLLLTLAHVLIHVQPCLLMCLLMCSSAYSAYSYTVVVQYIRTGWTPLFGS